MKIGNLYKIKYYWLLFPTYDIILDAARATHINTFGDLAANAAFYWSKKLSCQISVVPENSTVMLLEQQYDYYKVLTADGEVGWIKVRDDSEKSLILQHKGLI